MKQMQENVEENIVEETAEETEREMLLKSLWPTGSEIAFAIAVCAVIFVAMLFPLALFLPL